MFFNFFNFFKLCRFFLYFLILSDKELLYNSKEKKGTTTETTLAHNELKGGIFIRSELICIAIPRNGTNLFNSFLGAHNENFVMLKLGRLLF